MLGREAGLVAAGEAPDLMAVSQESLGESVADAGAGAGDDEVHEGGRVREGAGGPVRLS